jgi:hypothetical protein
MFTKAKTTATKLAAALKDKDGRQVLLDGARKHLSQIDPRVALKVIVPAVVQGVVAVKVKPGSKSEKTRASKIFKAVTLSATAAHVALKPVRGAVATAVAFGGGVALKEVHKRVTSKPARFVLTAGLAAAINLAKLQALKWAARQPRLQELDEIGLIGRQAARTESSAQLAARRFAKPTTAESIAALQHNPGGPGPVCGPAA